MMLVDDHYEIDILVQGYPGKSVCHGGLGWSTIVLLRGHNRVALIDAGGFGMRHLLIDRLKEHGLSPTDVTDLILSHSHYDHSVNWPLFRHANIHIGRTEVEWALKEPWGETMVPEIYIERLADWPTLKRHEPSAEILPHITAHLAPGHTPGGLVYVLAGSDRDIIFTGDAAKNRAEMMSGAVTAAVDHEAGKQTVKMIWSLWRQRNGSLLVPGHDAPMVLENEAPRYLGHHDVRLQAWLNEDLEQVTIFRLDAANAEPPGGA